MQSTQDQASSLRATEFLELLRCPSCSGALRLRPGGYMCSTCKASYPEQSGVVRFVDHQNYADSFGFQWTRYARTQLDHDGVSDSERHFRMKTGFVPEDLKGKLVLDVGCGMGRFAEVATRWGARVIGIDLSAAAEVAAHNLANRDFVALQADVFHLPFSLESFDCIYSIGVLHHTPNCEKAVKALPQYLKPGGSMAVWLYSGYGKWYRFSDMHRKYTRRLSATTLHGLLSVAVPFFYNLDRGLRVIPFVGRPIAGIIRHLFPVNRQPDPQARILDTFDWYSPEYQSKHTYEEVFRWFESCALEDLHVGEIPISIRGRKPHGFSNIGAAGV